MNSRLATPRWDIIGVRALKSAGKQILEIKLVFCFPCALSANWLALKVINCRRAAEFLSLSMCRFHYLIFLAWYYREALLFLWGVLRGI